MGLMPASKVQAQTALVREANAPTTLATSFGAEIRVIGRETGQHKPKQTAWTEADTLLLRQALLNETFMTPNQARCEGPTVVIPFMPGGAILIQPMVLKLRLAPNSAAVAKRLAVHFAEAGDARGFLALVSALANPMRAETGAFAPPISADVIARHLASALKEPLDIDYARQLPLTGKAKPKRDEICKREEMAKAELDKRKAVLLADPKQRMAFIHNLFGEMAAAAKAGELASVVQGLHILIDARMVEENDALATLNNLPQTPARQFSLFMTMLFKPGVSLQQIWSKQTLGLDSLRGFELALKLAQPETIDTDTGAKDSARLLFDTLQRTLAQQNDGKLAALLDSVMQWEKQAGRKGFAVAYNNYASGSKVVGAPE